MLFALQGCSNDDELKHIEPKRFFGTWRLTNIRGWEYKNDAHDKKTEFNETYNYNGQGAPVGSNMIAAQCINISVYSFDSKTGYYQLTVNRLHWNLSYHAWMSNESGKVTLKGNLLIDGTTKATITKFTDTEMTIYQKDEEGETYITYTKLGSGHNLGGVPEVYY